MNLKIFEESKNEEFFLKLQQEERGIELVACTQSGKRIEWGTILYIGKDGSLHLPTCVSEELGLRLDDRGRIQIIKEC